MELRGQLSSCFFCAILLAAIPFSVGFEVILSPTVTGIISQDVVLLCQISIGTQPDNMEAQWKKIIIETIHEHRAETGQDVPGQKYQGRIVLLKDGFTTGNVSLKLKNVQPADRGTYSCIVKSNEWSADAATELQIAEFKNGETLKEKKKKRERSIRSFPPETFENNTETFEKNTEKMAEANLDRQKILVGTIVVLIVIIIIGIIFFIYYCLRNRRKDPEKGTLISAEEGRGVVWRQSQDELPVELRRLQNQKDELQGELNWRRTYKYADDITLDAGTAHPNLSISGDQKSLKHETQPQNARPNPERFDSTVCVLASEGFSSGKHYWEVDVVSSTDWDLGVARKSIQRKGKLSLSPKDGFWALGFSGKDYWAKTDPWTRVMVQKKPKKIGIYLSYQDKQVTFFNVTDMSVLFTFNDCSFSGEVYPFFKNSHKETAMRICPIREDE